MHFGLPWGALEVAAGAILPATMLFDGGGDHGSNFKSNANRVIWAISLCTDHNVRANVSTLKRQHGGSCCLGESAYNDMLLLQFNHLLQSFVFVFVTLG